MIDSKANPFQPSNEYWAETHAVENLPAPLEDYNLYASDAALRHSVAATGGSWGNDGLNKFGQRCGSAEVVEFGFQANANKPELFTHVRYGRRIDEVKFNPSYHLLRQLAMDEYS